MPIRQLPDPQDIPGIFIDGVKLHAHGWRHGQRFFACTTEAAPDGRWLSCILDLPPGAKADGRIVEGKPVKAWNFATQDEAEDWTVKQYGQAAFGPSAVAWSTPKGKAGPPN